ncbi:MAG TPA: hypothetical protein PLS88_00610 [Rectinema sp.]|jgi:hypothetical protein|nr:hypothetical protein [Rectinema sp.]HOU05892.1 hypothetical protein [Rectinema sp.]HOW11595.1 hypothetical protein [Rectinema sp.]HPB07207.1 hypothetical protein [Rectinema sp.]HPL71773.1 hypothetical protein [Rectinema sp.]
MRTKKAIFIAACLLLGAVLQPFAFAVEGEAFVPVVRFLNLGEPLDHDESAAVTGGDVRMSLNQDRTKLKVNVIDNEYEARLGRIPPKEVFEIDVHNRVVDTQKAPFMPADAAGRKLASSGSVTSKPSQFPEGYWSITAVTPREDKYGPYMISTNAVGKVDTYVNDGKGNYKASGVYKDTGYAVHSNTNPFDASKSYGCLIVKQDDLSRVAGVLKQDREENPKAVQKILVRPPVKKPHKLFGNRGDM